MTDPHATGSHAADMADGRARVNRVQDAPERPVLCLDGSVAEPWFAAILKRIYSEPNQDYPEKATR